jgi:excisionase family DNA binding protein
VKIKLHGASDPHAGRIDDESEPVRPPDPDEPYWRHGNGERLALSLLLAGQPEEQARRILSLHADAVGALVHGAARRSHAATDGASPPRGRRRPALQGTRAHPGRPRSARGPLARSLSATSAMSVRVTELERRAFFTPKTLYLSISERTVRSMLANGTLPSYRVEGARRIDPADVDRYLANRREGRAA